jgi:hypothetical protein
MQFLEIEPERPTARTKGNQEISRDMPRAMGIIFCAFLFALCLFSTTPGVRLK